MPKFKTGEPSLEERLARLETYDQGRKDPILGDYQRFMALSESQRKQLRLEWDEFYAKCKETETYQLFLDMKRAMSRNDRQAIGVLWQRNRELMAERKFLNPPKVRDPLEYENSDRVRVWNELSGKQNFENKVRQSFF